MLHLQVGDLVAELAAKHTEKREDEGAIADGVPKLLDGASHHLEAVAEVGDRQQPLLGRSKLGGEQQRCATHARRGTRTRGRSRQRTH